MMLTGAYEGFVVACHRHRDQAHGYCSGFCWEGEESMLVCFCLFLCGSKRGGYLSLPLWSGILLHADTESGSRLGLHFRLQITSRECKLIKAGSFIYYVGVIFSC